MTAGYYNIIQISNQELLLISSSGKDQLQRHQINSFHNDMPCLMNYITNKLRRTVHWYIVSAASKS